MSTVLVTGGSGTLGSTVVSLLREGGHDVRVLSRRPGAGTHQGDLATGRGVAAAADGAEIVVHAASDTRRLGRRDVEQTTHLLDAAAGARHLLYISIVGIDAIPFAYYRRKLACEELVAAAAPPHTILRATQFHELLTMLMRSVERIPVAPLPLDFRFQPVAAPEVAARLVELAGGEPVGRAADMGGPEVLELDQLARTWGEVRGRPRRLVRLPLPGRAAEAFRQGRNTCPDDATGALTWARHVAALPPRR